MGVGLLVILGKQGAGKGTQCPRLAARYDVPHVATGDMLRSAVRSGSELGQKVRKLMDEGHLVPDELITEVVAHRLEHEYGVKARIMPSRYQVARWVTCDDPKELQRFVDGNSHRVAYDAVDAPTVLVEYAPELRAIESNWPKIRFHALREHAGLVFQKQLDG